MVADPCAPLNHALSAPTHGSHGRGKSVREIVRFGTDQRVRGDAGHQRGAGRVPLLHRFRERKM